MSHGSLGHSETVAQKWISIEIHQKSKVISSWRPREPTPAAALFRMSLGEASAAAGRLVTPAESLSTSGRSDSVKMLVLPLLILPPRNSMCHENTERRDFGPLCVVIVLSYEETIAGIILSYEETIVGIVVSYEETIVGIVLS